MAQTEPSQAPGRYAKWMDELKKLHRGDLAMHSYSSAEGVARRLMKTNPRLPTDKADWLARQWARQNAQGQWVIQGDPAHKVSNAQLYRVDEVLEIFRCIRMPTLAVEASDNSLDAWWKGAYTLAQYHQRLAVLPQLEIVRIEDAGHMMHHDQPEILAALIERFMA
jgi:pimeloyl-ACP methyl ester carboxylesterase